MTVQQAVCVWWSGCLVKEQPLVCVVERGTAGSGEEQAAISATGKGDDAEEQQASAAPQAPIPT